MFKVHSTRSKEKKGIKYAKVYFNIELAHVFNRLYFLFEKKDVESFVRLCFHTQRVFHKYCFLNRFSTTLQMIHPIFLSLNFQMVNYIMAKVTHYMKPKILYT